jgi:hypothetical protein
VKAEKVFSLLVVLATCASSLAISSKITHHSSSVDLLKGQTEDVVISSKGTIELGRAWEKLADEFEDVWSINSIVVNGGTVYFGTSPNGGIYRYSMGKLTKIYPAESENNKDTEQGSEPRSYQERDEQPNDANEQVSDLAEQEVAEAYLANEHIFAMATDVAGRLLVGISGDKCALCRFEADKCETIFQPALSVAEGPSDAKEAPSDEETKYIFAIDIDESGNIYLGTGPEGKVYQLDPSGRKGQVVYDSSDKNILSLVVGQDGFVYAGSDSRGLIYKIDPHNKTATVLYDSQQDEIAALLFGEQGDLYAAATSAEIAKAEAKFAEQLPLAGRPEPLLEQPEGLAENQGGRTLQIANTKKEADDDLSKKPIPTLKKRKPSKASYIYKVTKDGYVTDIFNETAVFFALVGQDSKLLVATGNSGQLFTVDPALQQEAIIYEDQQASQITAVAVAGKAVYLGTANPAKLIKLGDSFASTGTYTSQLIDAGQPAKWGKLQIEADIPQGCKVLVASRSGNVEDVNDPTFSDFSQTMEVTEPVQLRCPTGRFCQYKLVLQSEDGQKSPLIREIAVAHAIPNLSPTVESVAVSRLGSDKAGVFKIEYKAKDDNDDKLIYKIDFRKIGRTNWIELEDEHEADSFEWDGKTVEDGRYEIRVTASDERSNTIATKLTGSRISDPIVVDNTGPVIKKHSIEKTDGAVTLRLLVSDELSAIGQVHYTVDSNAQWKATVPDDLVYDTTEEEFTIVIEDLAPGEHIITVKVSDDIGNTTYKTFEINSKDES